VFGVLKVLRVRKVFEVLGVLRRLALGLLLAAALTPTACARPRTDAAAAQRIRPAYDAAGHLKRLEYDSDGDGKIDTWGYMDGARVIRVEVDENGDGQVDRWEYHSESGKTVERIERSTRRDGVVSRREYFDGGSLARIEEDTNGDGKIDKWETYTGGTLTMMALDTMARGTPDRRLVYDADGTLDRIEVDPTGSGHFQPLSTAGK